MRDFEYIRSATPWLSSDNAAGLGTLPVKKIANVEVLFEKHNGGLTEIQDSDNSIEAGAATEAFVNITDKFSLHGRLSYSYFSGKNMGGAIFMDPSYNPLNLYESVDTTVGVKNRELYNLMGGFSYSFNPKWSIGAEIDYQAGDQSKRKDPRFINVWMDLGVSAGFRYAPTENFSFGISAIYRRTLENINSKRYGADHNNYYNFIDYGGFYGTRELFTGRDGYVAEGDYRPMFNSFYGGTIQIEGGKNSKIFNEIKFLRRNGYYGKRSSSTVTFTEHVGNIIEYNAILTTFADKDLHRVELDFYYQGLKNNKNTYRFNTSPGGTSEVEYIGNPMNVLDQIDLAGELSYKGFINTEDYRPVWEYGICAEGAWRKQKVTVYPFVRENNVAHIDTRIFGTRNILDKSRNMFTIGIEGLFSMGFGNPKEDSVQASTTSDPPRSMDLYLNRDFEYKTAMQAGGCLRVRYTRFFGEKIAFYVEAKDSYTTLLKKPEFLKGNYRNILETKIGITF